MKKLLLILLCVPLIGLGQTHIDEEREEYLDSIISENLVMHRGESSHSLLEYTPISLNQGETGMCVAFALSTARSILYNRIHNIVDSIAKEKERFSPFFIYYIQNGRKNNNCDKALNPKAGLKFMKDYGFAKMKDVESEEYSAVYYDNTKNKRLCPCYPDDTLDLYRDLNNAEKFKIEDFSLEFGKRKRKRTKTIKRSGKKKDIDLWTLSVTRAEIDKMKDYIDHDNPILFGCRINNKWHKYDQYSSYKPLKLRSNFLSSFFTKRTYEFHSVVIIGYNDLLFGGSFQIINSWGRNNFGDNGVAWIKYKDFRRIKNGFIASLINESERSDTYKKEQNINIPNFLISKKKKKKYHFINTSPLKKCYFKKPKKKK